MNTTRTARLNTCFERAIAVENTFFQRGAWYGGSSMTKPARSSPLTRCGPNSFPTRYMSSNEVRKMATTTTGDHGPKNATASTGTTPQVEAQGTAHAMATVGTR